ncbi:MAG: bifunctional oligoribonuclease/PAP phosphatase NrnA [Hespellia sp.]|nr:bifunctional oligoribonuclease/PAP phosphatase NrnA [Hespellia sp.]
MINQTGKETLNHILKGKESVAISGHIRPDGDCVGSCMGLYLYLKENFHFNELDVYLERIPDSFHILQGTKEIKHEISGEKHYDLFICLDCGDLDRLGFSAELFLNAKSTFCVDHHISNRSFANENYVVPDASSTSELIFQLMDTDKISKATAEALYMGIAHDTGIFQYSCTAPSTMETAAVLLRKEIDANEITDRTYSEKTYTQNQILGKALLESMMLLNRKCIASIVTLKDLHFFEADARDLEGIVSQLRNTKGVEVAIFLYELEPQVYKVSLRSKGLVDVNKVAQYFGGGGHVRAAGCSMNGNYYDILNNIVRQIDLQLKETPS